MSRTQQSTPDVAIAIPHTGTVSMRWAVRLSELRMPSHTINSKSTAAIDQAREQSVVDALKSDPEWILFLDSDVVPPTDVFEQLRGHDLDVVSALYYVDNEEGMNPAMWRLDEYDAPTTFDYERKGLINVDAVGMGCLLVRREVLEEVERPWFRWTKGFEDHPWDLKHLGESPGISEDFYFCHKVKEAGYEVYVDTTIECLHEKNCVLSDDGIFLEAQLNPDDR